MSVRFMEDIRGLLLYIMAAVLAALLWNAVYPGGIDLVGNWDTQKGVISAGGKNDAVNLLHEFTIESVAEAKGLFDKKAVLFVDARHPEQYRQGHIPGAVSLPFHQFDVYFGPFLQNHDTETSIITYCSGRECADGHELARVLKEVGYRQIAIFIDGFEGWSREGLPIER